MSVINTALEQGLQKGEFVYFSDETCGEVIELSAEFVLVQVDDSKLKLAINQIFNYGSYFYYADASDLKAMPLNMLKNQLISLLLEPTEESVKALLEINNEILYPLLSQKAIAPISDDVRPLELGDVIYLEEEGIGYPTVVYGFKSKTEVRAAYIYDSVAIKDCDIYTFDVNNTNLRTLRRSDFATPKHLVDFVNNSAVEKNYLRKFQDMEVTIEFMNRYDKG